MAAQASKKVLGPQPGPQTDFLSTSADIAIYGGAAGGGKTFALLLEPFRWAHVKGFGAVIFRRTLAQVRDEGGIWDTSAELYSAVAKPNLSEHYWTFPSGATVQFAGIEHEADRFRYQGSQICLLAFDELLHFTKRQFFYLLSRNRSTCGVKPYVRATCNPGPGWVKELLAPWVDPQWPDPAQSGEIRWFVRDESDAIKWVPEGTESAVSITFIRSSVYDNPALLEKDPDYVNRLKLLPADERRALLYGDWSEGETHRVLSSFERSQHIVPRFAPPPSWRRMVGLDFGLNNAAAVFLAEDPSTGDLYQFDELHVGKPMSYDWWATEILSRCGRHPSVVAGGNATGERGEREAFRLRGLPVSEPKPLFASPVTQYRQWNQLFEWQQFFVMENCEGTISQIETFEYDRDRQTQEVSDKFTDTPFHFLAACRYIVVEARPPQSKPAPATTASVYLPESIQSLPVNL